MTWWKWWKSRNNNRNRKNCSLNENPITAAVFSRWFQMQVTWNHVSCRPGPFRITRPKCPVFCCLGKDFIKKNLFLLRSFNKPLNADYFFLLEHRLHTLYVTERLVPCVSLLQVKMSNFFKAKLNSFQSQHLQQHNVNCLVIKLQEGIRIMLGCTCYQNDKVWPLEVKLLD